MPNALTLPQEIARMDQGRIRGYRELLSFYQGDQWPGPLRRLSARKGSTRTMSKDLLLEVGTEEIPARFLPKALEDLRGLVKDRLESAGIAPRTSSTAFTTPAAPPR